MSLIKKNWREVLSFLFLFGEAFLSVWYTLLHFHLQQVRCWLFNNIKMPKPMILSKYCGGKTEGNIQLSLNSMNQVSLSKFLFSIVKWHTDTSLKPPGLINQVMILPLQLCYQFRNTIVSSQDENPWKGGKKMARYLLVHLLGWLDSQALPEHHGRINNVPGNPKNHERRSIVTSYLKLLTYKSCIFTSPQGFLLFLHLLVQSNRGGKLTPS